MSLGRFLSISFLFLVIAGCGYHIAGKGGKMPGDIASLYIPVFTNSTHKPDIEALITSAFVEEMVTTVKVVDAADGIMQGVIKSYDLTPVSYTRSDVNQEYRLTVTMSVKIVKNNTVIWEDNNISDYEDFTVTISSITATREAETAALKKLAKDTARSVKERVIDNF
ncbi:MAG: hypothetical protein HY954_07635 [Deltaproteobacteria bacterium]|nr:hypothetical protein [Deltaproteobacteria bacterium]